MKYNKGMSLIVLIITIVVIIILAAAIILILSKNNPIESAKEARFKEDIRAFQDDLVMTVSGQYTELQGQRDWKITTSNFNEIKGYIPSFTKKYEDTIKIENDNLVYIGVNKKEKEWFDSIIQNYEEKDKKYWDIEWNYSMGLLEDNDFEKVIDGDATSSVIEAGILLTSPLNAHILYRPNVETAKKSELEIILEVKEMGSKLGFRAMLSNGTYGCHISIRDGGLYVDEKQYVDSQTYVTGTKFLSNINLNTDYKINMYFDEKDKCKIYLDNKLIYQEEIFSYNWTSRNGIVQQNGGKTVLKSIKYKFY